MEQKPAVNSLELIDREKLTVVGVTNVASFDEEEIFLETNLGILIIKGEGLHITNLNLENSNLTVDGYIKLLEYAEEKGAKFRNKSKNIISKLLR